MSKVWITNCVNTEKNFGVHLHKQNGTINFYGTKTALYYTIRIKSPTNQIREIQNEEKCREKHFKWAKEEVRKYFEDVWSKEIQILKNEKDMPVRNRRFINIILGLAILVGSFFLIGGTVNHFRTERKFEKEEMEINRFESKFATEMSTQKTEMGQLANIVCQYENEKFVVPLLNYLQSHIEKVESIILSLTAGILPTNRAIYSGLKKACILMQPIEISDVHKNNLCSKIFSFNFDFEGVSFDPENNLLLHLTLDIPILIPQFSIEHKVTRIHNIGFFQKQTRKQLMLPSEVLMFNKELYELNYEKCKSNYCSFSALRKTGKLNCLIGLMENNTTSCQISDAENVSCLIEPIPNGYMVLAKSGLLVHKNKEYPEDINYEVVVAKEGHLFCSNSRNISFDLPTSSNKTLTLNEFKFQNNSILEFEQNLINLSSIENQSTGKILYSYGFFSLILSICNTTIILFFSAKWIYKHYLVQAIRTWYLRNKKPEKVETHEIAIGPSNRTSLFEPATAPKPYKI